MSNGLVDVVRNPIHATGVGLLLYGLEDQSRRTQDTPITGGLREILEREAPVPLSNLKLVCPECGRKAAG